MQEKRFPFGSPELQIFIGAIKARENVLLPRTVVAGLLGRAKLSWLRPKRAGLNWNPTIVGYAKKHKQEIKKLVVKQ